VLTAIRFFCEDHVMNLQTSANAILCMVLFNASTFGNDAKSAYPQSIPFPKDAAPVYKLHELLARDNVKLAVHHWTPPKGGPKKPVVILLHGIGMHGEPYASIAAGFTAQQMTLIVPDLRGHGRSGGTRGRLADASVLRSDLGEIMGFANCRHPDAPVFLAGESMGGLLAADYAAKRERRLAGLILLAPAFKVHDSQIDLGGIGDFFKGKTALATDKKLKPSTRVQGFIDARRKDARALPEVDSSYLTALGLRQLEWPANASLVEQPLFVGVAGQDTIVNSKTAKTVFDQAGSPKDSKRWVEWTDARHTICWDPLTPSIFEDLTRWINER